MPLRSASLRDDIIWTAWHVLLGIGIQLGVVLATSSWWMGVALAAPLFIGREHAQAEYRWIHRYGAGFRRNLPWWGGLDPRIWDRHSLCGWAVPVVILVGVAALAS